MPDYQPKNIIIPNTGFSVIIPARNEAHNIEHLLNSLTNQTYSEEMFEIIVVDDHSTDATAGIVRKFEKVKLIQLTDSGINSYKKKAIERGIAAAQNEWIVCTDADCIVGAEWLQTFASFIADNDPVFIAAPVAFSLPSRPGEGLGVRFIFQALDFLTLQGITAASVHTKKHNMCNGANLVYKRDVFYEVDGFKGIDNIASGDDMLLMHKIWNRYPDRVAYLKSQKAIVKTEAAPTWKAFINQRIRWASKAKSYDDKRIFAVLLLVYLFNLSFLVLLAASFFNLNYGYAFLGFWILKTIVEYRFVSSVSQFFNLQQLMKYFFFFQPLHIAYTIVAGFLGSFGKYEWKGRKVK
ncbi:glycosyltransferase [Niabella aquatica]